ncbi:MAG: calcium/sodium antiporter [Bacteroidales bacterium]
MLLNLLLLLTGFTALILGANFLVSGASSFARRFHVSELAVGLTIVAFGTSTPELVVNIVASRNGLSEVLLGNVIGSNIFNLLFILGISGTILPLFVQQKTVWLEIPISMIAVLVLYVLANTTSNGSVSVIGLPGGIILLSLFAGFLIYVFFNLRSAVPATTTTVNKPVILSIALIIAGLTGLILGGKLVVNESSKLAAQFGMSEKLIGLTIISIGTSLPELATSVVAALKKNSDMAIGNIIGSNIFNIFLVLGVCAVINPIEYPRALNTDLIILGISTLLLFTAMFTGKTKKLDRWESMLLVLLFIGYLINIITRN